MKSTADPASRRALLVVATGNPAKVVEFREALRDLDVALAAAADLGVTEFPPEAGSTYEANARGKAVHAARATGRPALADDSGLEVDALDGAPGVRSARFGGDLTTPERNAHLLAALEGVPAAERGARFVSAIVLATPDGETATFHGAVEGTILDAPRGEQGFGYDPLFFCPELGTTFAEASTARKRTVSHRGRALEAFGAWARSDEGRALLRDGS